MKKLYTEKEVDGLLAAKKSYYSVIPAEVRYSQKITANAKLIYSEITALSNEKGYCWAPNNYFANLYGCTPQAISRWIKELEKENFVSIRYIREGKEIVRREVSINIDRVSINSLEGINKKLTGYQQIVKENIKSNNTINIRAEAFTNEVNSFTEFPLEIRDKFIENWTEPNKSKTKMKFELEKTFEIKRRLKRWEDNSKKWNRTTQINNSQSEIKLYAI